MNQKKGQLQSGETIVVIIIVIIMLIVGLVYFVNSKESSIKAESSSMNDINAMKTAIIASSLNELKCSASSVMVKTCFDYYRMKSFGKIVEDNKQESQQYYYFVFKNSKIVVRVMMPNATVENVTLYDYNNSANKSSSMTFIPLIVENPMTEEKYFSILEVRTYS
jgi:hypothetical protein